MNTGTARMTVLAGERFACIKIIGRANFTSSIDFKSLIQGLRQRGCTYFVLDLSECLLMDSTFLGVLAGFGLKMSEGGPSIELLNPNARISELLECLGVLHLFKLAQGTAQLPEQAETITPEPLNPSRQELHRACLEAHHTLMEINPGNAARFKDVARFLAEDLKRPTQT